MNTTYVLEKGTDRVVVTGEKVSTDYSMNIEEIDQNFLVTLPAFNISFYCQKESEISNQVKLSLGSFLRHWFVRQGKDRFFEHMLELGFDIKTKKSIKAARTRKASRIRLVQGKYNLT